MQKLQPNNVLGCDISNHQGHVDFSNFKTSGIQFVYVKATEGTTYLDKFFDENVHRAKQAGLPIGAYHFAIPAPGKDDAIAQAQFFLKTIQGKNLELCPALDLEHYKKNRADEIPITPNQLVEWIQAFRQTVESAIQKKLILYTNKSFVDEKNGLNNALKDMPLWNASYWKRPPATVELPEFGGWTNWVMWQYTDKGTIPGVTGNVDLNYARSVAALHQGL